MQTVREFARSERGLTLVEIIAVIVLIGLIMGVVVSSVGSSKAASEAALNRTKIEKLKFTLDQYKSMHESGRYPATLDELVRPDGAWVPTINQGDIVDVWKNRLDYRLENNGRSYAIMSFGRDGVAGGTGVDADVVVRGP
jgi:general secretion pathway protein G